MKKNDPLPHYHICAKCAEERGGVPVPWPVTVMSGKCPYCGTKATLIPTCDFNWPKIGRKAVWD